MIDKKGYQNLLNQIKNNKSEFKHLSVDKKAKTYASEITNNKQIICYLEKEYENYKNYSKKLDSTVILNNIKQKIMKKKLQIAALKTTIHKVDTSNKKNEKILVRKLETQKKKTNFKKIIYEVDSHMNKCENLQNKIYALESRKIEMEEDKQKVLLV